MSKSSSVKVAVRRRKVRIRLPRPQAKYRALIAECKPLVTGVEKTIDAPEVGLRLKATLRWFPVGTDLSIDITKVRALPGAAKGTKNLIKLLGYELCLEQGWNDFESLIVDSPVYEKIQAHVNEICDRMDRMEEEDPEFDFDNDVLWFAENRF